MYFFMERKWQLHTPAKPKTPDKNGKVWPDQIQVTLKVECDGNIKDMVEAAYAMGLTIGPVPPTLCILLETRLIVLFPSLGSLPRKCW